MKSRRPIALLASAAMIAALALVVSCGSDNNTGGGGVGPKELDSGNMQNGASYHHTFASAGTFHYRCTLHGNMTGQVIVVGGSPDSSLVRIGPGNVFNPTPATVKPGGSVRWINDDNTPHTVTSN